MVRAALAQPSPVPGDSEANARRATALLADHPAVDLAVFPELFLVGYDLSRVEESPSRSTVRSSGSWPPRQRKRGLPS
jgi:predicted amidohydrolase